jgi:acyl carrier protein
MQRGDALELVLTSLGDVLADGDVAPAGPVDESTPLIGRDSVLDSLGLVQLIVTVEQRLQEEHGVSVTVADDRAMSQKSSPFRTVGALADYVHLLVEEPSHHA